MVDEIPIREFKNHGSRDGLAYPNGKAMKVYATMGNGEDWATMGGRVKSDWSEAPSRPGIAISRRREEVKEKPFLEEAVEKRELREKAEEGEEQILEILSTVKLSIMHADTFAPGFGRKSMISLENSRIEIAFQEAVALKRQDELIQRKKQLQAEMSSRPNVLLLRKRKRAKKTDANRAGRGRGCTNNYRKSYNKPRFYLGNSLSISNAFNEQTAKQKRIIAEAREKQRDLKAVLVSNEKEQEEHTLGEVSSLDLSGKQEHVMNGRVDSAEDASDVSNIGDDVTESLDPDLQDRDATPLNWDTDTSEVHPSLKPLQVNYQLIGQRRQVMLWTILHQHVLLILSHRLSQMDLTR
ncbi:hypothetical protein HPP92_010454 [Vanilla planifolia]|uniref:GH16 domain-containing protein n=1 Tax=Vanilla planifolia TaxID=51239 RepID=A0A835QYM3_VANPL|nr:hypothetical protein HPP92_010454 [Vanilla planifolia]